MIYQDKINILDLGNFSCSGANKDNSINILLLLDGIEKPMSPLLRLFTRPSVYAFYIY